MALIRHFNIYIDFYIFYLNLGYGVETKDSYYVINVKCLSY